MAVGVEANNRGEVITTSLNNSSNNNNKIQTSCHQGFVKTPQEVGPRTGAVAIGAIAVVNTAEEAVEVGIQEAARLVLRPRALLIRAREKPRQALHRDTSINMTKGIRVGYNNTITNSSLTTTNEEAEVEGTEAESTILIKTTIMATISSSCIGSRLRPRLTATTIQEGVA